LADAMNVYSSEVRGRAAGDEAWQKELVAVPRGAVSEPGMSEIGYPAFCAALIKLTILGKEGLNNTGKAKAKHADSPVRSPTKKSISRDYDVTGLEASDVENLFV
jgi:hypothetical protein